ncbi:TonB-dependent receptor [Chitinophaga sp. YR627]|nr:TonB-dependent receptor [Chitinophaga sp. YR627]
MIKCITFLTRYQRIAAWLLGLLLLTQHLCADAAPPGNSITLHLKNVNLTTVLVAMQKQSSYVFSFDEVQMGRIPVDEISCKHVPLMEALALLKDKSGITWSVIGNNIAFRMASPVQKQQPGGSVRGRVVDFETAQPLPGATVRVEGISKGAITDSAGFYNINDIAPGSYTLVFSYVSYATNRLFNVKVRSGERTNADFKLQPGNNMHEVVVNGLSRRKVNNTSDATLTSEIYDAHTVLSGISSEQIARTLDRDASEVVKRIAGVNISEDRFVIVRGLNKRYNLTFLNDAIAPASDADSRAFSYDVINSNAIDRILVYKSPSPDLPGEFAGGLVKIYTRKSQLTRQVDVQVSAQYRPGSSFNDVWSYAGSKTDFLGFDNGTRSLPKGIPAATAFNHLSTADNAAISRQFANNYVADKQFHAGPDLRFSANYYDAWKIGGKYLKNLTAVAYTNTHEQRLTTQNSYGRYLDGNIQQGIHGARLSLIQTNEMSIHKNLSFELRNFINQGGQRITAEDYRVLEDHPDFENRHVSLYYVSNFIYAGQVSGNYQFGEKNTLRGNVSYSSIHKSEPDNRDYTFSRRLNTTDEWALSAGRVSRYLLSRSFNDVKENAWQGNLDLHIQTRSWLSFKSGVFFEHRWRDFNSRTFVLNNGENLYDPNLLINAGEDPDLGNGKQQSGTPITVYEKYLPLYFTNDLFRDNGTGYRFFERTSPNNQYFADNTLSAGYLLADLNFLQERLNVFGGVRVEHNRFRILGAYATGLAAYPLSVDQPITSVLPSVNVSFKADSSFIIRAGYGKTLNRPEFREAAPMRYVDYLNQESYNGNPSLTTVKIDNSELRFEWYPRSSLRNDMINVGFFYKQLDRPIERLRYVVSEGFDQYFYTNTGKATVYGTELEIHKNLDFLPVNWCRDLSVIVNGSFFHSNVKVPSMPQYSGYAGTRERPMQGQSPYLINASLNYESIVYGTKISLTFNRAGDYIYVVGSNKDAGRGDPDIMMHARNQLDFTFRQRINHLLSMSAGVQNILNTPVLMYQDWKRNYHYEELQGKPPAYGNGFDGADIIYRRYYLRPYYSCSLNMVL